jgi:hypothetical protein
MPRIGKVATCMQSRLSKFRRQMKLISFIALGVLSACYVSEVSAVRVSLTFRGTVVGDPRLPNGGYSPESGVVPGMPVEGEVWWNDEEPVDLAIDSQKKIREPEDAG